MSEPEFETVGVFDGDWRFTAYPPYRGRYPRVGDRVDTPRGVGLTCPMGIMTSVRLPDGTCTARIRPCDPEFDVPMGRPESRP